MPLLDSHRYRDGDLDVWHRRARQDAIWASLPSFKRRCDRALDELAGFAALGPCWAGTSWGKDSTVLAHMCSVVGVRAVWFIAGHLANPDCYRVRDAFLARHDLDYSEETYPLRLDDDGDWVGYARVWDTYHVDHPRHVLGLRSRESSIRKMRMRCWGLSSPNTCAPIGWWRDDDVFAYLHAHDLPVHPAYAMSLRGAVERKDLRVDRLGGQGGRTHGREEWERLYYGDVLDAATAMLGRISD